MDRIQINGTWYVKEDNTELEQDVCFDEYTGFIVEQDNYLFECEVLMEKGKILENVIMIYYTNKDTEKKEYIDNARFLFGVLENNFDTMIEVRNMMDKNTINVFKKIIQKMVEKKWINKLKQDV